MIKQIFGGMRNLHVTWPSHMLWFGTLHGENLENESETENENESESESENESESESENESENESEDESENESESESEARRGEVR